MGFSNKEAEEGRSHAVGRLPGAKHVGSSIENVFIPTRHVWHEGRQQAFSPWSGA